MLEINLHMQCDTECLWQAHQFGWYNRGSLNELEHRSMDIIQMEALRGN